MRDKAKKAAWQKKDNAKRRLEKKLAGERIRKNDEIKKSEIIARKTKLRNLSKEFRCAANSAMKNKRSFDIIIRLNRKADEYLGLSWL